MLSPGGGILIIDCRAAIPHAGIRAVMTLAVTIANVL